MFIRKNSLFVGVLMICVVGTGIFCLAASAGESEGKKGKAEITWLYPPKYHDGSDFSEGRAWVQEEEDGPWSLLDDQGNVLKTGLEASGVTRYSNGIAIFAPPLLTDDDEPSGRGLLNRSGDEPLSPALCDGICGPYSEGLIARKDKDGLVGFIDLSGKWVIPPAYDYAYNDPYNELHCYYEVYCFQEGLAAVRKGRKWGFIDKTGAVVIDFKFDNAYSFSNKMARVRTGSTWGVIDTKGRWIVKPLYEEINGHNRSDLIAVGKDNKVGFIDSKGDVVIDFQYIPAEEKESSSVYFFNKGRAIVILGYKDWEYMEYGIIDESGSVLLRRKNCKFFFAGDYILCRDENEQLSLIDRENREYGLSRDSALPFPWIDQRKEDPYPFRGLRDGKIGYFTISVKDD